MTMTLSQQYPDLMLPVKRIQLTKGQHTIVDPEKYERVMACGSWYAHWDPTTKSYYAARSDYSTGKHVTIYMHTFITGFKLTDHRNRVTLDNRCSNLRDASPGQSQANKGRRKDNTSGHVGISWDKRDKKWVVHIGDSSRPGSGQGYYANYDDAVAVYHSAAREVFGEFAPVCCDRMDLIDE